MFENLNPVSLQIEHSLWYGIAEPTPEGTALCELLSDIAHRVEAGERQYFGVTSGEYAGSIFYFEVHERMLANHSYCGWSNHSYNNFVHKTGWETTLLNKAPWGATSRCHVGRNSWNWNEPKLFGRMRFDGRKNKPGRDIHINGQCVYLPGYKGKTVYQKFDRAAAERTILEEIKITDRNGEVLAVGDDVIYVNLRYGSGGQLDYGTIKAIRVKPSVDPMSKEVSYDVNVIVSNKEGDGVEESTITKPDRLIIKEVKK